MKRSRDVADESDGDEAVDSAEQTGGAPSSPHGPASREHLNATLGATLRSVDLGKPRTCFLCTYTDEQLAQDSILARGDDGPIERVSHYWKAHVDVVDSDKLAEDCLRLLRERISVFAPPTNSDGIVEDSGDAVPRMERCYADVTAADIKKHFTECDSTDDGLPGMKLLFRQQVRLASAASGVMYSECPKCVSCAARILAPTDISLTRLRLQFPQDRPGCARPRQGVALLKGCRCCE
jgi:hypothetical protein